MKFDNEAEIDTLRGVIREYQRRRLQRSEYAAVMTLLRQTYEWKSKIALEKGDRGKAIAELKSLEMLGDEGSKAFASYLRMNLYLAGYLSNKSKTDAQNTRDAARALIENQPGLLVFIPEESQATVLAMIYLIQGSMENDLGNYADAVRELELAQSLLPSDEDISKALQIAKTNNRTGGKQWLSIADILNQVELLKQNLPTVVPSARSKNK